MVDIESLRLAYFTNMEDVPYNLKRGGKILIKPILVKDYNRYEYAKQILEIDKNSINDINVIKMSYLDFIMEHVVKKYEGEDIFNPIYQLYNLLFLCIDARNVSIDISNNKHVILICDDDGNIEKIINHKEFDDIKEIILNQNDINYDGRYINPEVKELMVEYNKIKYSDIVSPSLETKKGFVASKTGKTFKEINEIPYREFELIYNSSVNSEIYLAQKITEASYKYEVKDPTKHPLFEKKKDPYSEIFEDTSVLSGKGISGVEKLNMINMNN